MKDRFDPIIIIYNRKIILFKYQAYPLKYFLTRSPQYGANETGVERIDISQPRYIRITDIDDNGFLNNELGATANNIEPKYYLNDNDLIFARSGATVGKSYIYKKNEINYKCFFAGYMIRFEVDKTKILPDYLFIFTQLKTYKNWVNAIQRAAAQPNINAEEYKSLLIPLPPFDIQNTIVKIYQNAAMQKQSKETKAQELIDGIDDYLLSELGIKIPKEKPNTLKNRIFKTSVKNISGNRFDPEFYKKIFLENFNSLKNNKFNYYKLTSQIKNNKLIKGSSPQPNIENKVIRALQISNINIDGDINYSKFAETDLKYYNNEQKLNINDIIIVITGATIGKIGIWEKNLKEIYLGGDLVKFQISENINLYFIYSLLLSLPYQIEIKRNITGATNGHLSPQVIKNLPIPLPPIDVQNKIAEAIKKIREEAKRLRFEASSELENAKKEIERMLLK